MINGRNVFDQQVKKDLRTYDNIQNIATGQEYDYSTGCLLDYPYVKKNYKMIAIHLINNKRLMLIQKRKRN